MVVDPSAPRPLAKLLAFLEANSMPLAAAMMVAISMIIGMTSH